MDAYTAIKNVTGGKDLVIPIRASDFCELFDGKLTPAERQQLLDDVVGFIKSNPRGVEKNGK